MADKVAAKIIVSVGETNKGIVLTDIDFDRSRNQLAFAVGSRVVDTVWEAYLTETGQD